MNTMIEYKFDFLVNLNIYLILIQTMKKLLLLMVFVGILTQTAAKNVEIPPVKEKDEQDIRLRSLEIMK